MEPLLTTLKNNDLLKQIQNNSFKLSEKDIDKIKEHEKSYVTNNIKAERTEIKASTQFIPSVEFQKLKKYNHNFFDGEYMRQLAKVVPLIIQSNNSALMIKDFIKHGERIGDPSANGIVFKAELPSGDNFIIKVPINPKDDLTHEAAVGMLALNNLRGKIQNFSYIFGYFSCNVPTVANDNQVLQFCNSQGMEGEILHVIYEAIAPAKSLSSCIKNGMTQNEFVSTFCQFILALTIANNEYGFVHKDAHDENFLVEDPQIENEEFVLDYNLKNFDKTFYVKCNKVLKFIDYGYSTYRFRGQKFGIYGLEYAGIDPMNTNALFDVFKLLGFCLRTAYASGNGQVVNACIILRQFFMPGETDAATILKQSDNYFTLAFPKNYKLQIDDFVEFLITDSDAVSLTELVLSSSKNNDKLLKCKQNGGDFVCDYYNNAKLKPTDDQGLIDLEQSVYSFHEAKEQGVITMDSAVGRESIKRLISNLTEHRNYYSKLISKKLLKAQQQYNDVSLTERRIEKYSNVFFQQFAELNDTLASLTNALFYPFLPNIGIDITEDEMNLIKRYTVFYKGFKSLFERIEINTFKKIKNVEDVEISNNILLTTSQFLTIIT